ncbi:DNA repair helicase XPB [Cohnella suwonensis]|uniref:DNA 3'-5' helicase n=1 Tax=Cohnella suwonensis TaxID=696072 RepID=A0ABW0M165_9BACL
MATAKPLWVQSDGTLLLDERHSDREEARRFLMQIAELRKRPGTWHTYRMTQVSLWNAAAAGWRSDDVAQTIASLSGHPLPRTVETFVRGSMDRFGQLRLVSEGGQLRLRAAAPSLLRKIAGLEPIRGLIGLCSGTDNGAEDPELGEEALVVKGEARGTIKRELAALGYPVKDEAGFHAGQALDIRFLEEAPTGSPIALRDYQSEAVDALLGGTEMDGGSGVVVLPCGAGKTWVGMAAMTKLGCETLILTPNGVSVAQWMSELLRHTTLTEADVGEYTGRAKDVKPVTVATYQVLTHRSAVDGEYPHMRLFVNRDWGLIVYDEVHLLPAPVFRMTADIQATRRLGLTATLVREDGREGDAFALIGPKLYELPWRSAESGGWIARATCTEVRVPLDDRAATSYAEAPKSGKHRIAGENPRKADVVKALLRRHRDTPTLVIGHYLDQLHELSRELGLPLITGETPHRNRLKLFERFKCGDISALLVSKVANFAVDLPDAAIAIQVSGSYGSRQEEAQRLGRILRPKRTGIEAAFYSLVSEGTDEVEFARNRGRFLLEQGYSYAVDRWSDRAGGEETR